jgi:hypothetical protein
MAVTIGRTLGTDDDGSGTTGTVVNVAWKTELYNQIDTALALVLPLAGGTLVGDLKFTDATYDIGKTGATRPRDGFFSRAVEVGSTLTVTGAMKAFASGGINLCATATDPGAGNVRLDGRQIIFGGLSTLLDMYAAANVTGGAYLSFRNAAGTVIGSITELAGNASVAFNTTSDKRLKTDRGVATDLSILERLVIHDFDWSDGTRDRGVFAQDAHAVSPRAITVGTDDRLADGTLEHPWQTDYSKYVPDLIVGWQHQAAQLAALAARIAALEQKGISPRG